MIRSNSHQFAKSLMLVSVGLLAIGLVASTSVPAFAGSSGAWTKTGSLNVARGEATATLLPNGQVLVADAIPRGRGSPGRQHAKKTIQAKFRGEINEI
jgi:hypothetical protein